MGNIIVQYQKAYNTILEKLKGNESILAVMVFGSMITGDLWDESDIDLFVVMEMEHSEIKNIYTEENLVSIHIKLMSKEKFLLLHETDLPGGFIHRIFASSRLIFSKDIDVTTKYNNGRYYTDLDKERWNMVYLGNLIKNVSMCKKYRNNKGIHIAYTMCVKCMEDYAKLYINSSGYMISKDVITMAMNLNDDYKRSVDELFFNKKDINVIIGNSVDYLEKVVNLSINTCTTLLMEFMRQKDCLLSSEDIVNDMLFKCFDIDVEGILNELWKRNMIKKGNRELKYTNDKVLIKENVYFL